MWTACSSVAGAVDACMLKGSVGNLRPMFQAKITLSTRPPGTQNAADGVYIANDFFFKTFQLIPS
jgi:hypothetical protein